MRLLLKFTLAKNDLSLIIVGVYSGRVTPDPISNSEVKPTSGDGIAVARLWESSTAPTSFLLPGLRK